MSAEDYSHLACPNPDCPVYAQRGAGNLRLHGWSGRGVFNFTVDTVTVANLAYNMIAIGGGTDYSLTRSINLRGDFEYQKWFSFPPNGLSPTVFSFGGAYHFH